MKQLNANITDEGAARIDGLCLELDVTPAQLLHAAIMLIAWAHDEVRAGNTIASCNEGHMTYKEIDIFTNIK
jgi:hypothetical protein